LNLAKLKEDLKYQAEAISELRKQTWDNTGTSSYLSIPTQSRDQIPPPKQQEVPAEKFLTQT